MLRMAQADSPDASRAEGIRIAQEMVAAVRPYVQGVQVSVAHGHYADAAEVLSGVLPQAGSNGVPAQRDGA
jgi:methionine synthase / methylenetetrahydrofolate reductase(NADPH)